MDSSVSAMVVVSQLAITESELEERPPSRTRWRNRVHESCVNKASFDVAVSTLEIEDKRGCTTEYH